MRIVHSPAAGLRRGRVAAALILCALGWLPAHAQAQEAQAPAALSLEDAVELALRFSPAYRSELNDVDISEWDVREAWGALLPSAAASAGFQYTAEGQFRLGAVTGSELGVSTSPASYVSDYALGVDYFLDGATIARLGLERSRLTAASAEARAAAIGLATQVRGQYVTALGAQDAVGVSQREVELAQENLDLARALVQIGSAPELEATQAEVALGRARVNLLIAQNDALAARLDLLRIMGVEIDREVTLTSTFEVFEPTWEVDALLDAAMSRHPRLRALRANRDAGHAAVRAARLTYLPTLSMSAGWSGFAREIADEGAIVEGYRESLDAQRAQCVIANDLFARLNPPLPQVDCNAEYAPDPAVERRLLADNNAFPFGYEEQPFSAAARITLPIFQGFQREARVQEARVLADDARYALRAEELQLHSDVITAHRSLETAFQTVQLEARNQELAEQQLELARERYRLGALSYIDLSESTTLKAQADRAFLASVYAFHQALAALEAAVGRPLTSDLREIE